MSTGKKTVETKTTNNIDPMFGALKKKYVDESGMVLDSVDNVAMTPEQQYALSQMQGDYQSGKDQLGYGINYLKRATDGAFLNSNEYLQPVLDRQLKTITDKYQQSINPQIEANATRSGIFGGSAFQDMTNKANQNLATELGNTTQDVLMQNYQNERQVQDNAARSLMDSAGSGLNLSNALYAGSAQGQAQNQLQADEELRRQQVLSAMLAQGYVGGTTTGVQPNPNYRSAFDNITTLGGMATKFYGK